MIFKKFVLTPDRYNEIRRLTNQCQSKIEINYDSQNNNTEASLTDINYQKNVQ